jgi:hypothetical protein
MTGDNGDASSQMSKGMLTSQCSSQYFFQKHVLFGLNKICVKHIFTHLQSLFGAQMGH